MTVELRRFGHRDLPQIRQTLLDVHADAYADNMTEFDEQFPWFIDHWGGKPDFVCILGYDGSEPVGFAYGAPPVEGREAWRDCGIAEPANPLTFMVSELMVRPKWRKTGTSKRLHDALLDGRHEALAVLLVDPDHPKVQTLYESWEYRKVGRRQPFPDSPNYAVMLRELKAGSLHD